MTRGRQRLLTGLAIAGALVAAVLWYTRARPLANYPGFSFRQAEALRGEAYWYEPAAPGQSLERRTREASLGSADFLFPDLMEVLAQMEVSPTLKSLLTARHGWTRPATADSHGFSLALSTPEGEQLILSWYDGAGALEIAGRRGWFIRMDEEDAYWLWDTLMDLGTDIEL